MLDQFVERVDVSLGHLECFEFGQFAIAAEWGHDLAQFLEGVVETVHASAFPRVGGCPSLLHDFDGRRSGRSFAAATAAAPLAPRLHLAARFLAIFPPARAVRPGLHFDRRIRSDRHYRFVRRRPPFVVGQWSNRFWWCGQLLDRALGFDPFLERRRRHTVVGAANDAGQLGEIGRARRVASMLRR